MTFRRSGILKLALLAHKHTPNRSASELDRSAALKVELLPTALLSDVFENWAKTDAGQWSSDWVRNVLARSTGGKLFIQQAMLVE